VAVLIAVCVLGLVCTGAAFVAYFDLIHRVGPVSAVTVTLLAPVFGIAWAVVLLGEQISLGLVVGVALVLVGVVLIVRPPPAKAVGALTASSDGRSRLTTE
jgi:drug/metabolite transporter (DMT)-like permease